jgi:hypothetical protein
MSLWLLCIGAFFGIMSWMQSFIIPRFSKNAALMPVIRWRNKDWTGRNIDFGFWDI